MSKKKPIQVPLLPNPHAWLHGASAKAAPAAPKKESIREWYARSTGWAGKVIVFVTLCSFVTMGIMWAVASLPALQRIQTFNGALTIPLIGGVWIFGFIFMFLVPSREASFRGQESMEAMGETVEKIAEKVSVAVEIWSRIGSRIESEFPAMLQKANATLDEVAAAAKRIDKAGEDMTDLKPAIEALRRLETRLETEIQSGLIEDIRTAAKGVKNFTMGDGSEPDFQFAQESLRQAQQRGGRTA